MGRRFQALLRWIESHKTLIGLAAPAFIALFGLLGILPRSREDLVDSAMAVNRFLSRQITFPIWAFSALLATSLVAHPVTMWFSARRRDYRKYRKDTIKGVVWRWDWLDAQIEVQSLKGYCEFCDRELEFIPGEQLDRGYDAFGRDGFVHKCGLCHCVGRAGRNDRDDLTPWVKAEIERRARAIHEGEPLGRPYGHEDVSSIGGDR